MSRSHTHTPNFHAADTTPQTQENTYSIHRIRLHELRRNANHARRCDRRRDRTRDVLRNAVIQRLRLRRSSSSHTLSSFSSRPAPWPLCLCVSSRGSRGSIRDTSTGHSCCLHRTTRIAILLLLCFDIEHTRGVVCARGVHPPERVRPFLMMMMLMFV